MTPTRLSAYPDGFGADVSMRENTQRTLEWLLSDGKETLRALLARHGFARVPDDGTGSLKAAQKELEAGIHSVLSRSSGTSTRFWHTHHSRLLILRAIAPLDGVRPAATGLVPLSALRDVANGVLLGEDDDLLSADARETLRIARRQKELPVPLRDEDVEKATWHMCNVVKPYVHMAMLTQAINAKLRAAGALAEHSWRPGSVLIVDDRAVFHAHLDEENVSEGKMERLLV